MSPTGSRFDVPTGESPGAPDRLHLCTSPRSMGSPDVPTGESPGAPPWLHQRRCGPQNSRSRALALQQPEWEVTGRLPHLLGLNFNSTLSTVGTTAISKLL